MMRDWWNEWKWKFERIDEENERKRKCVKNEEINQISFVCISNSLKFEKEYMDKEVTGEA